MRILLTGASGFIGGHLLLTLLSAGHHVVAAGRRPPPARPGLSFVPADFRMDHAPEAWSPRLSGIDVVVNAVGIIREEGGNTFEALHHRAPLALFEVARRAGVPVVQVSALGTTDDAPEPYYRSKRLADRFLEEAAGIGRPGIGGPATRDGTPAPPSFRALVLKPSFVYGPGDHSMAFFKKLALLPVVPMVGDGSYRSRPVHVSDLCALVLRWIEGPSVLGEARPGRSGGAPSGSYDVGGGTELSFRALLQAIRRWWDGTSGDGASGYAAPGSGPPGVSTARRPEEAFILPIPLPLIRLSASLLGARGPITPDELSMLLRGATCDNTALEADFSWNPLPFAEGLALDPPTAADRREARLLWARPLLRLSVGFIWIATGITTMWIWPRPDTLALLRPTGLVGPLGEELLGALCLFEVALGLATCLGWRLKLLGTIQLLLMLGFMVCLAVVDPRWWFHPYGPLTKNVPLIGATVLMMALED